MEFGRFANRLKRHMTDASTIRFAVGDTDGLSSNSWRVWRNQRGDVYIRCRDGYKELKVSLHGTRWRVGMTEESAVATADRRPEGQDRAWMKWERPAEVGGITMGFRILFLPSELAVLPEQRISDKWKAVDWVPAPPAGCVTIATVTLNREGHAFAVADVDQWHGFIPLSDGGNVQLTLHTEQFGDGFRKGVSVAFRQAVEKTRAFEEQSGTSVPQTGRIFLVGRGGSDDSPFSTELAYHRPARDPLNLCRS